MFAYTNPGSLAVAGAVKTAAAAYKIKLFKNNVTFSNSTQLADLTEADFTGYAPITASWGAVFLDPSLAGASFQTNVQFDAASPFTVGNTVYGFYITDTAGTLLVAGNNFPAGVSMAALGDSLPLSIKLNFGAP